ncbi:MAG: hypothetical protein ACLQQ4_08430 [Bacteroidia bacterium]
MKAANVSATNTHDKAEKIKKNMSGYAEKSKETIHELIQTNSKLLEDALGDHSKILNSIKNKFTLHNNDTDLSGDVKSTLAKSVKLAEDTFDAIINSYTRQMELIVDFNTQLVELVKDSEPHNAEKFLELIHENFERSRNLTINNTKEILDFYNKHTNLAINFNEKFAQTVNSQIDNLFQTQKRSLDKFTHWASEWWNEK